MGIIIDLIPHFLWDVIKTIGSAIPKAMSNYRFKQFFGSKAINSDKIYVVLDPYEHSTKRQNLTRGQTRFIKDFKGRKENSNLLGEDKLLGSCSIRVTKYSSSEFAIYREQTNPIKVVLDEEIMNNWEGTFICAGSSDSNIKTYDIESLNENNLYNFEFKNGYRCFNICGTQYTMDGKKDMGIILRINNPYHDGYKLFICAGIGGWGTSGSAYYLFKNWRQLQKRFGSKTNFILGLQVDVNSDESAREVREYKI